MAIKTLHNNVDRTWLVTFTCYRWLPLFEITDSYDLVYNWLNLISKKKQSNTLAFVIMPNHVHLLLHLADDVNLNTLISNAKRFMAYEIIKRLKDNNEAGTLQTLRDACSEKEKSKGQIHRVFEPSFDAKPIYSDLFLHQKLNYIHQNPVNGKWHLSIDFIEYKHSSAAFYELGSINEYLEITDFRDV